MLENTEKLLTAVGEMYLDPQRRDRMAAMLGCKDVNQLGKYCKTCLAEVYRARRIGQIYKEMKSGGK